MMPSALTTEEWIAKAKAKHGESYDYSEVVYLNGTTKVKIRCPKHGIFLQTPHAHARLSGGGKCPDCVNASDRSTFRRTTEEWVTIAKKKRGEKYDYSEVDYVNARTQVRIGCAEHGIFLQTPKAHLRGKGGVCPDCVGRSFTTEQWIAKAREKHGDRYDYSEVDYINSYTKVRIRCGEHGIFLQTPNSHSSRGTNCPDCQNDARLGRIPSRKTTEEWISIAREIHGDRYDYSEVEYVNNVTKVRIRCREHGIFLQGPYSHSGYAQGCPDCAEGIQRLSDEVIIDKFKEAHGDKYDYSDVVYKNEHTKVKIGCPTHGEFLQRPHSHRLGTGCPDCADKARPNRRKGREGWIDGWREKHGKTYDYSLVDEDITQTSLVKIICREHGEFQQRAQDHNKHGCAKCARPMQGATNEEWVEKFREVHGDIYDYSKVQYVSNNTHVTIVCKEHGDFSQVPSSHIIGTGCPSCAEYGFDPEAPAVLYCMRCSGPLGNFWKVGITNNPQRRRTHVQSSIRSTKLYYDYVVEIEDIRSFEKGNDAKNLESKLLEMESLRFVAEESFVGSTELFSVNPLYA